MTGEPTDRRLAAAGIAHDLANILAAIAATAEEALARSDAGAAMDGLHEIRRYAERGAALAAALIGPSPPAVRPPPPLSLAAAIADLLPLLRRLAGPVITVAVGPSDPSLAAPIDAMALERVLTNLVANARDAMPDGGTITLHLRREQDAAVIEVADGGVGIPPELLGCLFEPFVTSKRGKGGSGLGLATVREIAHAAGGAVMAENAPGGGARILVRLPLAAPEPRTILLVEDEAPIRRVLVRAFERAGWQAWEADSAETALALLNGASGPPDLLLTDLTLPGEDGLALIRAARRLQPGLPAMLVSGYSDAGLRRACEAAGVRLVAKPVAAAALLGAAADLFPFASPVAGAGENI